MSLTINFKSRLTTNLDHSLEPPLPAYLVRNFYNYCGRRLFVIPYVSLGNRKSLWASHYFIAQRLFVVAFTSAAQTGDYGWDTSNVGHNRSLTFMFNTANSHPGHQAGNHGSYGAAESIITSVPF